MHHMDLTLPTVAENLALDEALLLEAEENGAGEVLRFWHWDRPAVVLGAGGSIADDVNETSCQQDGVPILRRASGGGTVLLGHGCLCITLVLATARDPALQGIRNSYRYISSRICAALDVRGLEQAGISDLAIAGRKVSGSAQERKRSFILHHATLLHDFDASLVERYLRQPARQPDYRRKRSHAEFMANLPLDADTLHQRLRDGWSAEGNMTPPLQRVRELVEQKYGSDAWLRRR
jgi:lipoate-protein ligase A